MKKKAFTLFSTLVLVFIFSILIINIFEIKSLNSKNITNQYKYIQAKNHLNFLDEYIHSLENLELLDKIKIENSSFDIYATIDENTNNYSIDLYIKDLEEQINLHKKLIITK